MGRHSAEPVEAAHATRSPVTDPHLFDRPLAAPRTPSRVDDPDADAPSPQAFAPVPVRRTAPASTSAPARAIVPRVTGASLLEPRRADPPPLRAQDLRYARTGEIPVVTEDTVGGGRPGWRREVALAAASVAVVGALSGAAVLLPSSRANAEAGGQRSPATGQIATTASNDGRSTAAPARCFSPVRPPTTDAAAPAGTTASTGPEKPAPRVPPGQPVAPRVFSGAALRAGMALWQVRDVTLDGVRIVGGRSGIDFERTSGTITLNRPAFADNGLYDLRFATDRASGKVVITDPVLAPGQRLRIAVPLHFHGAANAQRRSDIRVLVGGVDRTSELVRFV